MVSRERGLIRLFFSPRGALVERCDRMVGKSMHHVSSVLAALMVVGLVATAGAQVGAPASPQTPGTVHSGQTYAPIGESGYKVPIPEFKMRNFIGESGKPPEVPKAPEEALEAVEPPSKPAPVQPTRPTPSAQPVPREIPQPAVPRLPFEPSGGPTETKAPSTTPPREEKPVAKESQSAPLKAPLVPEDVPPPLPIPKKEVLPKTSHPGLPPILDAEPAKESLKTLPLESAHVEDMADPRNWIQMEQRREPEVSEPEPSVLREAPVKEEAPLSEQPALREVPRTQPPVKTEVPRVESPPAKELARPEPPALKEVIKPEPPAKESVPEEQAHQPMVPPEPKESVPVEEPAPPPAKEAVPSPLESDALQDPGVRAYVRATAPILEELSLVMTRAPSLAVADYDPSEANPPVFPKEILLKMESLKRELRILDSKTFEIIPPAKFAEFHSLIRQSITQTYQACDAVVQYFTERNEASLQKVREHLLKARELIEQTRRKT